MAVRLDHKELSKTELQWSQNTWSCWVILRCSHLKGDNAFVPYACDNCAVWMDRSWQSPSACFWTQKNDGFPKYTAYIKEEESSMLRIRVPVVWIKDINHIKGHTFWSCKKILISKTYSLNSDTSWDLLRIDCFVCIPRDRAFLVSWPRKQMKNKTIIWRPMWSPS